MVEPTYFYRNCAIVFGWVFHRLCKNLHPFNDVYEYLGSVFLRAIAILFAQMFPDWNSLSIYMENLFTKKYLR